MGVINSINETSTKAIDTAQNYAKATKEYYRLQAFKQIAKSFSFLSKMAIIGCFFFLGLILLVVSGTIWLGKVIGDSALACLIIAGMLFLIAFICYLLRRQIDKSIIRKISKDFFD